jgi:hypothetical protein
MSAVDDWRRLVRGELPAAMLSHPDCKIAIINVYDLASNRHLGRHPAGNERGAVDDQDAVRWMRDLKIGEVAGADFAEIAPLVVVVAFGMRVDEIIRTKCVQDVALARPGRD